MARPEPATDPLDRLISQSEATLQRIESLQKGRTGQSAGQRVVTHLTKHGGHIINLALAGCVFVVAYGQLTMKRKHEVLPARVLSHFFCLAPAALESTMRGFSCWRSGKSWRRSAAVAASGRTSGSAGEA